MSLGTLYTTENFAKGKIIRAVAALGGLKYDLPEGYVHFETNKTDAYKLKFPGGTIPAWESKDGFHLFESAAIARYLAGKSGNASLLGKSDEDAALVDQWSHFVETEVDAAGTIVWLLVNGRIAYSKAVHTVSLEKIETKLAVIDKHLATRTFLVGERITLADLWVAGVVYRLIQSVLDPSITAKVPNVIRHFETVTNQPALTSIFTPIERLSKPAAYVAPAKEKKEKEPKAPAPPKAEKKEKKKDDDEDEDLVPAEPKTRNPLDDLPKSATFDLEQWKREYSNKETRGPGSALEWFYPNFDKEGYSVWRVDFKYNEELTQTFMSSNQIGGFFNRLEASRKYLFGSVGVLGEANNSIISGVLIARGKKVEGVVDAAPDWESYTYTPLDLEDPKQKEFFEAALAWDLEIDGKKWADGKNFK